MAVHAAAAAVSIAGSMIKAKAQQDAANAQASEAHNQQQMAINAAMPSPEELAQLSRATSLNDADVARKKRILDSSDPAMIELGHQTLAMLRGEKEVGTNSVLRHQIDQNREKLKANLQAKYGPGWESTSAGMQAMNNFEQQAGDSLQMNQQNTLNSYLNYTNQFSREGQQQGISNASSLASQYGNIQSRVANAAIGTGSNMVSNAGNQYLGGQLMGSMVGQVGGMIGSGAFNGVGSSLASMFSQKKDDVWGGNTPSNNTTLANQAANQYRA